MDLVYAQTEQYLKPLWKDLRRRDMLPELVAGLYMIVQAVQQRNYLQAYDIYVRLAIGAVAPCLLPCDVHVVWGF